jgi:hypothetical protein
MGTIDNFRSMVSSARGFARTAKFSVEINPPALLRYSYTAPQLERVNLFCHSIEMPGHDLTAQSIQHGSAPAREMVTGHDFAGTIVASFYLSNDLNERKFFEKWQQLAVNKHTHKASYYDDYIGEMDIFQLSTKEHSGNLEFAGPHADGKLAPFHTEHTYGIRLTEVYPEIIGKIQYDYGESAIAKLTVNFQYREWKNLNI